MAAGTSGAGRHKAIRTLPSAFLEASSKSGKMAGQGRGVAWGPTSNAAQAPRRPYLLPHLTGQSPHGEGKVRTAGPALLTRRHVQRLEPSPHKHTGDGSAAETTRESRPPTPLWGSYPTTLAPEPGHTSESLQVFKK